VTDAVLCNLFMYDLLLLLQLLFIMLLLLLCRDIRTCKYPNPAKNCFPFNSASKQKWLWKKHKSLLLSVLSTQSYHCYQISLSTVGRFVIFVTPICGFLWYCRLVVFAVQRYARAVLAIVLSVRPSVCLFVTRRYCVKTAKRRIMVIMPNDSTGTLVFCCQRSWWNSNGVTAKWGAKCRWGRLK